MSRRLRRLVSLDWDAIAGVLAAVIALILHLLHLVEPGVLLTIALVILALLLIRDLRRERQETRVYEIAQESSNMLFKLTVPSSRLRFSSLARAACGQRANDLPSTPEEK